MKLEGRQVTKVLFAGNLPAPYVAVGVPTKRNGELGRFFELLVLQGEYGAAVYEADFHLPNVGASICVY